MTDPIVTLKNRLNRVENRLLAITIEISQSGETSNSYWTKIQSEIRALYEEARIIFSEWIKLEVPAVYDAELREQIRRIKLLKFKPPMTPNYETLANTHFSTQSQAIIITEATSDFILALDSGQKKLNRLLRSTQQLNITEKLVEESITAGFEEKGTIYGASGRLQEELLKDALDQKYIMLIDQNGKPRKYKIQAYAELVAKTKFIDAQANATVNTAIGFGSDLVQVSSHNTLTLFDAQFEGKIFSLSGKDPDFPQAVYLPAFHPNCKHTISVYFRDAHTQGQVEAISDFSLGKTEIHPTRKSHVPVSKRKK